MPLWFLDRAWSTRAFELMELYADRPMDLADASLITAAHALSTRKIFTLDREGFETYRILRGHRYYPVEIICSPSAVSSNLTRCILYATVNPESS
jgi:hypothetical protein